MFICSLVFCIGLCGGHPARIDQPWWPLSWLMHHPKWHINSGLLEGMKYVNLACFKSSGVFRHFIVYLIFMCASHLGDRKLSECHIMLVFTSLFSFFFLPYLCWEYECFVRSRFAVQWGVPALGHQAKQVTPEQAGNPWHSRISPQGEIWSITLPPENLFNF